MSLAQSSTDIANMAVSNLGSGKEINDLATERSQEASAIRRVYDTALNSVLTDNDWGFNRKIETLALVTDFTSTKLYPWEWNYAYQKPSDALIVRRLGLGNRIDPMDPCQIPFEIQNGTNGDLILTNLQGASAQIGIVVNAVERYPADFILAFSMLLSALASPRLSNGDALGLGAKAFQKYQLLISQAQKNDITQGHQRSQSESDMIRERDL